MRFNRPEEATTTNMAGGEAHSQSGKMQLVSLMLSSFLDDTYYESVPERMERLRGIMDGIQDKRWLARAVVYARREFGMRSITAYAAAYMAKDARGKDWAARFYHKAVKRPDDMGEILSAYQSFGNEAVPNAMKKGFARAMEGMDEYALAKYAGGSRKWNLRDLVNVCHPRATEAITKLMKGEARAETWEVLVSEAGSDPERKKAAWKKLVDDDLLGYLALLRNLRNIDEYAPESLELALMRLTDKDRVAKSLVFPFQILKAFENVGECDNQRKIAVALSDAMDASLANVPSFDGKTLVAVDSSGSMSGRPSEIASIFAAVIAKRNDGADVMSFADDAEYHGFNPSDSVMGIRNSFRFQSGGTNFNAIFWKANKKYDRIVILSDMQAWVGGHAPRAAFSAYRSTFQANPKIYSFDLAGNGTLQFPEDNVYCLAGWSDKALQLMGNLEKDGNALIMEIDEYESV